MTKRTLPVILIVALAGMTLAETAVLNLELSENVRQRILQLKLKPEEAKTLTFQKAIAVGIDTKEATEIAGTGAVIANGEAATLIETYRSLAFIRRNPTVIESGSFSASPSLNDLAGLTIDNRDLFAMMKCRVGDCDVKLSASEIAKIQALVGKERVLTAALKARLSAEYKKILFARVSEYLAKGDTALDSYADKSDPVCAKTAFASLVNEHSESADSKTRLQPILANYTINKEPRAESFIYWAKQRFGDSKPVINIVQVFIHQEGDKAFVISKQLYASHYTEAGLMLAEIIPFTDAQGRPYTLVVNTVRLKLDLLGGTFGFMKKRAA
ncbi:MAG TPA: hypothetical protein VEF04_22310, partial [Blastocatellia bacterium]|nr:hypothetical protein [Blastocatellia bacterium]